MKAVVICKKCGKEESYEYNPDEGKSRRFWCTNQICVRERKNHHKQQLYRKQDPSRYRFFDVIYVTKSHIQDPIFQYNNLGLDYG